MILRLVPTYLEAREGSHSLILVPPACQDGLELTCISQAFTALSVASRVIREDLGSGCNHPGRRELILKRVICASPFGYQIIETIVPKEMEFPCISCWEKERLCSLLDVGAGENGCVCGGRQ